MFKKEILDNQKKIQQLQLVERHFDVEEVVSVLNLNKILALIGPRRAGKTFLSFQIIKTLIKKNIIDIEQVVYLDFSQFTDKEIDFERVLGDYFFLFPNKQPFFLLDEVQELNNFPEKLIWLLNRGYKLITTGSNAHLLSKELSTILRGKVYTKEILPLDFWDFLTFNGVTYSSKDFLLNTFLYKNLFFQYLQWGGFPEIVLTSNQIVKENILKTYLDVMVYKDLIDRYSIKNDFALNYFIKKSLTGFTKEININKIFNDLKSQGIKIGKNALYSFFGYLENVYFTESLSNYWAKLKGLKKPYLVDVSFLNLINREDIGKRFENVVYFSLRKKYSEIFFLSKSYEIDFFVPTENLYIQVVYQLDDTNSERELTNLQKQNGKKIVIYFEINNANIPKQYTDITFIDIFTFLGFSN